MSAIRCTEMKDFKQPPAIKWKERLADPNFMDQIRIIFDKVIGLMGAEEVKDNFRLKKKTGFSSKDEIPLPDLVPLNYLFHDHESQEWEIPISKLLLVNESDLKDDWENCSLDSLKTFLDRMLNFRNDTEDVFVFKKLMKEKKLNKVFKGAVAHSLFHLVDPAAPKNTSPSEFRHREKDTDLRVVRLYNTDAGQGLYDLFEARLAYCSAQPNQNINCKNFDTWDPTFKSDYPTYATREEYLKEALAALRI